MNESVEFSSEDEGFRVTYYVPDSDPQEFLSVKLTHEGLIIDAYRGEDILSTRATLYDDLFEDMVEGERERDPGTSSAGPVGADPGDGSQGS